VHSDEGHINSDYGSIASLRFVLYAVVQLRTVESDLGVG
jgi:hypothetical protein